MPGEGLNVTPEGHSLKKFNIQNVLAYPPQSPTFRPPLSETTVRRQLRKSDQEERRRRWPDIFMHFLRDTRTVVTMIKYSSGDICLTTFKHSLLFVIIIRLKS